MSSRPLVYRSALEGLATAGRFGKTDGTPGVFISERVGLGIATLASRKGHGPELKSAVRQAYAVDLPHASRVVQGPEVSFVGHGQGQWLAVSVNLEGDTLARDLFSRLKGLASISDQSGGRTVLTVSGPQSRDALAKGLPIDLDPRVFPLGSAATSAVGHMGVQLWQVDDTRSYDIAFFRSLSGSFWHWLTASAAEYGYEILAATR